MTERRFVLFRRGARDLRARSAPFLILERPPRFPNHEARNAEVDRDGNNAHDEIHVARALQHLDQLRADFRAAHGPDRHDQAQFQVDIAECAVPFRRHDRFADYMGKIGAHRKIPIEPDRS